MGPSLDSFVAFFEHSLYVVILRFCPKIEDQIVRILEVDGTEKNSYSFGLGKVLRQFQNDNIFLFALRSSDQVKVEIDFIFCIL